MDAQFAAALPQLRDGTRGQVTKRLVSPLQAAPAQGVHVVMVDDQTKRKRANVRLALLLAVISLGFLVLFVIANIKGAK